jgi:hypothetical protein
MGEIIKMNWFKFALDFGKRNTVNQKIIYLEEMKETLKNIADLVFQSAKNAKETNYKIISSSKITSYPSLHEILIEADSLALDSPWKFQGLCHEGISKIDLLIYGLKEERKEMTYGDKKQPKKGWF